METHFYIFRHGQTIWNAEGRPHGQDPYPVPLTLTGRAQVEALANKLADKNIKLIISSDLLRAQQTSEIIAEKIKAEIIYDKDLREVDYGKLNGLYALEREDVYPDYRKCYEDYNFPFPEGESFKNASERLRTVLEKNAKQQSYQSIAVSTHGNIVDMFLELTFGKRFQKLSNCDFIHISYIPETSSFVPIDMPPDYIGYCPNK